MSGGLNLGSKALLLALSVVVLTPSSAPAEVPLGLGEDVIYAGTEIHVLGPGPDLLAIIAGIADAGKDKRYLVRLGPGIYDVSARLDMQPFVDVQGSGENVTIVRADLATSSRSEAGVVHMALNATLSDLTVENTAASGNYIVAVSAYELDFLAPTSGVEDSSTARLRRVTARAAGSPDNSTRAIHLEDAAVHLREVTAEATGTYRNYGVRVIGSPPSVVRASSTASGGSSRNRAFYYTFVAATASETTASATGTESYGYYVSGDSAVTVLRSTVRGESGAVELEGTSSAIVAQSLLEGGAGGSDFSCVANTDENGEELDELCAPIMPAHTGTDLARGGATR